MNLNYADIEDFLIEAHRIHPEKKIAFRGRIKHLQRLGWPPGTNKGKGSRVQYGIGQTLSLAVAIEMIQIGMTPEKIVDYLKISMAMIAEGFKAALDDYGPYAEPIYHIFYPESLRPLRGDGHQKFEGVVSTQASRSELADALLNTGVFRQPRMALVNLTYILDSYIEYFVEKGLGDPHNLDGPMMNWLRLIEEAREISHEAMIAKHSAAKVENGDT